MPTPENDCRLFTAQKLSAERKKEFEAQGVSVRKGSLTPATPERGYPSLFRTPGGRKARVTCQIGNSFLVKSLTPAKDRVILPDSPPNSPASFLPLAGKLECKLTLEKMLERKLKKRKKVKYQKKMPAREVFALYGVDVNGKRFHWSHLFAHFLVGDEDLCAVGEPGGSLVNLVPATSTANYNVLKCIELRVKKILQEGKHEVYMKVTPKYGENQRIPELMVYELRVGAEELEIQYIDNLSHRTVTRGERFCMSMLRQIESEVLEPDVNCLNTPSAHLPVMNQQASESRMFDRRRDLAGIFCQVAQDAIPKYSAPAKPHL